MPSCGEPMRSRGGIPWRTVEQIEIASLLQGRHAFTGTPFPEEPLNYPAPGRRTRSSGRFLIKDRWEQLPELRTVEHQRVDVRTTLESRDPEKCDRMVAGGKL